MLKIGLSNFFFKINWLELKVVEVSKNKIFVVILISSIIKGITLLVSPILAACIQIIFLFFG